MSNDTNNNVLFSQYYAQWIDVYKKGAIREATMAKYLMTQRWVEKLVPELRVSELTRTAYQQLLNDYAREHERQTTLDFHHQLKGAILDAVDEGMIERDPTRKAIIKGKTPKAKKIKYLNQFELHTLIADLDIKEEPNWDWFILLVAKTGMRFSDDDDKIRLNQRKPSKYKGLSRFGPEKNLQRINKFMKERPIFYKNLIQMKENFRFYLRCFYCITKVVILQFNSENRTELARNG
ncbi:MAG: hypothetical protein ACLVET_11430 [Blautia wexlerae]